MTSEEKTRLAGSATKERAGSPQEINPSDYGHTLWVAILLFPGLTDKARLHYQHLLMFSGSSTSGESYASAATLAEEIGELRPSGKMSSRTITRARQELVEHGLIKKMVSDSRAHFLLPPTLGKILQSLTRGVDKSVTPGRQSCPPREGRQTKLSTKRESNSPELKSDKNNTQLLNEEAGCVCSSELDKEYAAYFRECEEFINFVLDRDKKLPSEKREAKNPGAWKTRMLALAKDRKLVLPPDWNKNAGLEGGEGVALGPTDQARMKARASADRQRAVVEYEAAPAQAQAHIRAEFLSLPRDPRAAAALHAINNSAPNLLTKQSTFLSFLVEKMHRNPQQVPSPAPGPARPLAPEKAA